MGEVLRNQQLGQQFEFEYRLFLLYLCILQDFGQSHLQQDSLIQGLYLHISLKKCKVYISLSFHRNIHYAGKDVTCGSMS